MELRIIVKSDEYLDEDDLVTEAVSGTLLVAGPMTVPSSRIAFEPQVEPCDVADTREPVPGLS